MKIKYFGTAAYEGIPSLFCQCESCKRALREGGKNLRTRAQALVDDEILLDFNADTVAHYQTYKFDWTKVKHCLITHGHSDHFYPNDITMFAEPGYTHDVPHIDFYGAETVYGGLCKVFAAPYADSSRGDARLVKAGDLLSVGDYKVVVMSADHDQSVSPVFYGIENKEGKRLLYAHDTGVFTAENVADMKRLGKFDFVSLDCTGAYAKGWRHGHMCLDTDAEMKELLVKEGLADENTKFVVTHFSHNGFLGHDHEELSKEAAKYGFVVGYDGLEVEF